MHSSLGKIIILVGLTIVLVGAIIYLFGNRFDWIGNLPGDVKVEKENFKFYFPFTTMILLSILVSVLLPIIQRFF